VEALARQVEVGTFLLIVYFLPFCLAQPHLKFSCSVTAEIQLLILMIAWNVPECSITMMIRSCCLVYFI
jgi:hypothetical protein